MLKAGDSEPPQLLNVPLGCSGKLLEQQFAILALHPSRSYHQLHTTRTGMLQPTFVPSRSAAFPVTQRTKQNGLSEAGTRIGELPNPVVAKA
jgi:hypothetical protein